MKRQQIGALQLIGLGWYVAICITLGILGGLWLDSALGLLPLFTLLGLFAGLGAAFYGVYRMVLTATQNDKNEEDA
ncbi:MAG: AtpZ/AtpI family protein [Chloroflexota bacterium]|nr:MAG: AtpZ/AtpI family protein [Chloroflexota bacterium]